MKKQAFNPYLPSWEYVPDGEPYVFGDRVYVYGSHDYYNGYVFCMGDYVGWSAPVDDLGNWRYEGVIYEKTADPLNKDGKMCLYAPDITMGPDGRYYLYYVLDKVSLVSVAVSDSPAGPFSFYGYVKDNEGVRWATGRRMNHNLIREFLQKMEGHIYIPVLVRLAMKPFRCVGVRVRRGYADDGRGTGLRCTRM